MFYLAFRWWRGGFPKFPYTNFHEANLDYFLSVFSEIWTEWEEMYNNLTEWKNQTDVDFQTWKSGVETALNDWKTNFEYRNTVWQDAMETNISDWETAVIADLDSWKDEFIDSYNDIESRVESIVSDTEDMIENLAPPFSNSTNYNIGDYVIYTGILYKFIKNHSAGDWDNNDVIQAFATDELLYIKNNITESTYNKVTLLNKINPKNGINYEVDKGTIKFSGTTNANTISIISNDIVLPAGTYRFSGMDSNYNISIQIYHHENGVVGSQIYQGRADKTFTLDSDSVVYLRTIIESGTAVTGAVIRPQIEVGSTTSPFIPGITGIDYVSRMELHAPLTILNNGDDLDDYYQETKDYYIGYSTTVLNSPITVGQRYLEVFHVTNNVALQTMYAPQQNLLYSRQRTNGVWDGWKIVNDNDTGDTVISEFTPKANTSILENSGKKIKILSYNVANYNKNTATYISNEQIANFKKMLYKSKADIIGLQENREYIDSNNTKKCIEYIYKPVYPFGFGGSGVCIESKTDSNSYGKLAVSSDRSLEYALIAFDNSDILFISAHPTANYNDTGRESMETINQRRTEYENILKWANGIITLTNRNTETPVSAPIHDYVIIALDGNTITTTDKENLLNLCNTYNYTPSNGDYIGWVNTHIRNQSLDNILVSSNCIIDSFEVYETLKNDLYSDHLPIVAEITLT